MRQADPATATPHPSLGARLAIGSFVVLAIFSAGCASVDRESAPDTNPAFVEPNATTPPFGGSLTRLAPRDAHVRPDVVAPLPEAYRDLTPDEDGWLRVGSEEYGLGLRPLPAAPKAARRAKTAGSPAASREERHEETDEYELHLYPLAK